MKFVKRDVCLWTGGKATTEEVELATKGLERGELRCELNGLLLVFAPMNGAKGLKPIEGACKEWNTTKYGTEVDLVVKQ